MNETEVRWTKDDAGAILAASAVALVLGGYCFGREDHSTYLPMMWHIQDPTLFQGDLLIESAKHMHMYFWHVMAWLTMVFPTEPTFFVVHALTVVGTCIAAYGTSLTLFRSRAAAYLGLVLLLMPKGLFGLVEAGINSQPLLTQTNVAVCLLSFAIWAFLANRYIVAFLLVGVAFNSQGMTACFVLAMFALWLLVKCRAFGWQRLACYALAFLIPALPTIIHVIAVEARTPAATQEDVALWIKIMRLRMAHHVFPLSWSRSVWLRGLMMVVCFVVAFFSVRKFGVAPFGVPPLGGSESEHPEGGTPNPNSGTPNSKVAAFAGAVLALCVVGLVFSEWVPVLKVMQFQLFRSTRFVMYLGLLYLAADCAVHRRGWQGAGSACGLAGMLLFPRAFTFTAPLLFLYLASRARRAWWLLLAHAVIWAAIVLWRHPAGIVSLALPCWILAAMLALTAAARPGSIHERETYRSVLLAFLLLLAVGRLTVNYTRHARLTLNPMLSQKAWQDAQRWCRRHTAKTATFLVPIYRDSFRCFSMRPIVADFKDAGPHMYCMSALREWNKRMTSMGLCKHRDPAKAYKALSAARLRSIARRWGASYVVADTTETSPFDNSLFTAERSDLRGDVAVSVYAVEPEP